LREIVGLERGPLSLVITIEEEEEKVAAPAKKTEIKAIEIRLADYTTPLCPQTLALTSPTSGNRSVGTVRSWIKAMELLVSYYYKLQLK
jgi:hypothetical protein